MAERKKNTKAAETPAKKAGRPRKKAVEAQPEKNITQQPKNTFDMGLSYVVTTTNPNNPLNVRSGAGKEFKVVRQIPNNTTVIVYELNNGWGRVGPDEWVMMSLLKNL